MSDPGLPVAFTDARLDVCRTALVAAYSEARELYDPDRGYDDLLFGQIVYHVASNRLERGFEGERGVQFVSLGRGPELWIDGLRVRWNKVGRTAETVIATAFPRGSAVAVEMASANRQLRLWADQGFDTEPTNWVLAHVGNPREGLVRLYLAAPLHAYDGAITHWASWYAIYDASQPAAAFPTSPAPGLPESNDAYGPLNIVVRDVGWGSAEAKAAESQE